MSGTRPPAFESAERRDIYAYVERHGTAEPREVWEHCQLEPADFHHQLAMLRRDGYLEKVDGKLRVVLEAGAEETYETHEFSFAIRPARQEDLSSVLGAIRTVVDERRYVVAETVAEQLHHENVLVRRNDRHRRLFFVATVDAEVVGWAHVQAPELGKLRHTAELTVGVLESYRRHGIGSHLLSRGLQWAAASGYEKVYNSLPATNADGVGFLVENGWTIEAVRSGHYRLGRERVDEVMLAYAV